MHLPLIRERMTVIHGCEGTVAVGSRGNRKWAAPLLRRQK